ncbi:MAG: LITAF-like zinc ribbon domain-containing protein [Sumerlaeia bacterium]
MKQFRVALDSGETLTYSESELEEALRHGRLADSVLVWCEGMADWKPAIEVFPAAFALPVPASADGEHDPYLSYHSTGLVASAACPVCGYTGPVQLKRAFNTTGVIILVILLVMCWILFWIPLVIDSCYDRYAVCPRCRCRR